VPANNSPANIFMAWRSGALLGAAMLGTSVQRPGCKSLGRLSLRMSELPNTVGKGAGEIVQQARVQAVL